MLEQIDVFNTNMIHISHVNLPIGFRMNDDKMENMGFDIKKGDISTLNRGSLKLVYKSIYLRSSVSSIEDDINMRLTEAWIAIDRLSDKIKRDFSKQLLNGYTTRTLTELIEKKLEGNCTRN